jgi:hypothetical protein
MRPYSRIRRDDDLVHHIPSCRRRLASSIRPSPNKHRNTNLHHIQPDLTRTETANNIQNEFLCVRYVPVSTQFLAQLDNDIKLDLDLDTINAFASRVAL